MKVIRVLPALLAVGGFAMVTASMPNPERAVLLFFVLIAAGMAIPENTIKNMPKAIKAIPILSSVLLIAGLVVVLAWVNVFMATVFFFVFVGCYTILLKEIKENGQKMNMKNVTALSVLLPAMLVAGLITGLVWQVLVY